MLCAFSNANDQTINPGESAVFTVVEVPCNSGLVRHRLGGGNFLLAGRGGCPCKQFCNYLADFSADIGIPEGGTVGPITVAIALDGVTIPASTMTVTPAATLEFNNVSKDIVADVWRGCCESVSVRNTSSQPITMRNAFIRFDRPELFR